MFSIYIANATDASYSAIQFGGYDSNAFKDPDAAIEFHVNNNADDYAVPLSSYKIGTEEITPDGAQAVFDPSYPYIYLPYDDFMIFAERMTHVFPTWPL